MRIELPCFLYNLKMAQLEIEVPDIEAKVTIDSDSIESVRNYAEKDSDCVSETKCMVHMKSGDSYLIGYSYSKMLELWP